MIKLNSNISNIERKSQVLMMMKSFSIGLKILFVVFILLRRVIWLVGWESDIIIIFMV